MDNSEIEKITFGRIEPHIYAFNTNSIPNYLKIGDTYRPIKVRLEEWKKVFPNLTQQFEEKATITDDVYFRDYSIHQFLEDEKGKHRLTQKDLDKIFPDCPHYSNEFFRETENNDILEAIEDIKLNFEENTEKYQFYNTNDKSANSFTYERSDEIWQPRPNQQEAIDNYLNAVKSGRKNLLMYAVMRFGKSFTSMCCAEKTEAKFVVVVSAKADVKDEWKKTVEIPKNFEKYDFLESKDLIANENILKEKSKSNRRIVLFLTLQDLQGEKIKEKHKQVFENDIDLLIVDETHFGARAENYGKVLKDSNYKEDKWLKKIKDDEFAENEDSNKEIDKTFKAKIKLHLSGTPYRILMGSEFQKEDIISFCQFADIVKEQENWDKENILKDEVKEWDNPYYGFPQMLRFAFNPNVSSRLKLEQLKKNGSTYAFSALFRPKSMEKDANGDYKKFENEKEILELFETLDGSRKDDQLMSFLDYDKFKKGKMCRHIVVVLPYCASCDALEELIKSNKDKFKNLNSYKIINISGIDNNYKKISDVKNAIRNAEKEDIKTLTLTVNRMLTGSTVEQWDTMLYFKDTSSPQEYDQAIFRLQNQYIKILEDKNGDKIKFNMKPQTLLVDFDPMRLFKMQETKSLIYNVNTDESGNNKLQERLKEELRISPIIALNINSNKMVQITPTDIMKAVSDYSKSKGVAEETVEIPVDLNLMSFTDIYNEIDRQGKLGSKEGFSVTAAQGEGNELDTEDSPETNDSKNDLKPQNESKNNSENSDETKNIIQKWRTYYSRILFFAFLTKTRVKSVEDIVNCASENENSRILENLSIKKNILELIHKNMDKFSLRQLDYKIDHLNELSTDNDVEPLERAMIALKKFGRLSESEVVTPSNICDDMVNLLTDENLKETIEKNLCILDLNSKLAEFAIALYKRFSEKLKIKSERFNKLIYSIPSSKYTYEFTRKIYEILGLDINCIAKNFVSYDLLKVKNGKKVDYEKIRKLLCQNKPFSEITMEDDYDKTGVLEMKYNCVLGNPPYQIMDGGAQASASPVYNEFVNIAENAYPTFVLTIMPSRWYAGGKGLDEFRDQMLNDMHINILHDFLNPELVFPNTNIRGGLCYFLWDINYDNSKDLTRVVTHSDKGIIGDLKRTMKTEGSEIFIRSSESISIIQKVFAEKNKTESFEKYVSSRKPFGLDTTFAKSSDFKSSKDGMKNPVECYGKGWKLGFVERELIKQHSEWIDTYKLFAPYANNIGTELNDDNLVTVIGKPNTVCTESYLIIGINLNLDENSSKNLSKYCKTRFARFMHSLAKVSQHATSKTYKYVPLQDFTGNSDIDWTKSVKEIDEQLYVKYGLSEEEKNFVEKMIKEM